MTEELSSEFQGGLCVRAPSAGSTVATFVFNVKDTDVVRRLIEHMYIQLDLCEDSEGDLAYELIVPDRGLGPWRIKVSPDDIGLIEETQGLLHTCPTFIRGARGNVIGLADFAMDLDHDWSGKYAKARLSFEDHAHKDAIALLEAVVDGRPDGLFHARRLLGRCHLAEGQTEAGIAALRASLKAARLSGGERLHSMAASSLCDLAGAFALLGRKGAAAACLLHALELRPNNPSALLDLAEIFSSDEALVDYALARSLAVGNHDNEVAARAEKMGIAARVARAEQLAGDVRLSSWPYGGPDFQLLSHIESALDALDNEAPPAAPQPREKLFGELKPKAAPTTSMAAPKETSWLVLGGIAIVVLAILVVIAYMVWSRAQY